MDVLLAHKRQLRKAESFDKVFQLVETALEDVFGVGELYVYDTSLRRGAKLGLFPTKVYLHAGTRVGARALGFDQKAKTLSRSVLPPALRALEPHEIEDMLCIFKDKFKDRTEKPPSACIQTKLVRLEGYFCSNLGRTRPRILELQQEEEPEGES